MFISSFNKKNRHNCCLNLLYLVLKPLNKCIILFLFILLNHRYYVHSSHFNIDYSITNNKKNSALIAENSLSNQNSPHFKRNLGAFGISSSNINSKKLKDERIFHFLNQVTGLDLNKCEHRIMQGPVLRRLESLNSLLSMCHGYCRVGMTTNGLVYGSSEFSLESKGNFFILIII
jgi:hypothetical protein